MVDIYVKNGTSMVEFNSLTARQKWQYWKQQNGQWACKSCGTIMADGPNRARPFHGCSVNCGECDSELTRRTGGGQLDPFNWKLISAKEIMNAACCFCQEKDVTFEIATTGTPMHRQCLRKAALGELESKLLPNRYYPTDQLIYKQGST